MAVRHERHDPGVAVNLDNQLPLMPILFDIGMPALIQQSPIGKRDEHTLEAEAVPLLQFSILLGIPLDIRIHGT